MLLSFFISFDCIYDNGSSVDLVAFSAHRATSIIKIPTEKDYGVSQISIDSSSLFPRSLFSA